LHYKVTRLKYAQIKFGLRLDLRSDLQTKREFLFVTKG